MTNVRVSPLLLFVQSELKIHPKLNGKSILTKAKSAIDNRLINECLYQTPPSNNPYLTTFYTLLNNMDQAEDKPKLLEVQKLLNNTLNCC